MLKILLLLGALISPSALAFDFSTKSSHIIFDDDIKPTKYTISKNSIKATVSKSASALIYAFDTVTPIKTVSFEWRSQGKLKVRNAGHEKSKKGDDYKLRVGLILSGKAPMIPFFAPGWVKAIKSAMKLPSNKLRYLAVDAKHPAGKSWESPYSDSMTNVSLPSKDLGNGWNLAVYSSKRPHNVVGVWVMADGDNTKSSFESEIRNLRLR